MLGVFLILLGMLLYITFIYVYLENGYFNEMEIPMYLSSAFTSVGIVIILELDNALIILILILTVFVIKYVIFVLFYVFINN